MVLADAGLLLNLTASNFPDLIAGWFFGASASFEMSFPF